MGVLTPARLCLQRCHPAGPALAAPCLPGDTRSAPPVRRQLREMEQGEALRGPLAATVAEVTLLQRGHRGTWRRRRVLAAGRPPAPWAAWGWGTALGPQGTRLESRHAGTATAGQ